MPATSVEILRTGSEPTATIRAIVEIHMNLDDPRSVCSAFELFDELLRRYQTPEEAAAIRRGLAAQLNARIAEARH